MALHPSVEERLARLAPDQRAAAMTPAGPVLCVAPAGSGKTTTLVARIAWLVDTGTQPDAVCAVTFNKRAADELGDRLTAALEPLGVAGGTVRVRTFHALGREMLRSAGRPVEPLIDRTALLRRLFPSADRVRLRQLDDRMSRLKLDRGVRLEDAATAGDSIPGGAEFVAYESAVRETGGLDFDDLVVHAMQLLEDSPSELVHWRAACRDLLVDEVQDVDRTQLRLALHLATPENRIFLVGDDDQSIYGWRLADVRRVLALADALPGLRRIDLVTNYRCPGPVVRRAVRLIETNRERFRKQVHAAPNSTGLLVLAPDSGGGEGALRRFLAAPLPHGTTRAVLARTNRELMLPLAIALDLGLPVRATARLLLEEPAVDVLLDELLADATAERPLVLRLGTLRDRFAAAGPPADFDALDPRETASALLGWAARADDDATSFAARVRAARARLETLRTDDAPLILATAHGTKGLEFDEVAVIGLDEGRFPSERTLAEAEDPERALEEERRLAYVAWTRAKRALTLIYDPLRPSPFLLEAFSREELNLPRSAGIGREPVGRNRRGNGSGRGGTHPPRPPVTSPDSPRGARSP
jgi:DNA helicase-2/ATP-dependent DNA helicase PcrA